MPGFSSGVIRSSTCFPGVAATHPTHWINMLQVIADLCPTTREMAGWFLTTKAHTPGEVFTYKRLHCSSFKVFPAIVHRMSINLLRPMCIQVLISPMGSEQASKVHIIDVLEPQVVFAEQKCGTALKLARQMCHQRGSLHIPEH